MPEARRFLNCSVTKSDKRSRGRFDVIGFKPSDP
jgi:hypothetical protein